MFFFFLLSRSALEWGVQGFSPGENFEKCNGFSCILMNFKHKRGQNLQFLYNIYFIIISIFISSVNENWEPHNFSNIFGPYNFEKLWIVFLHKLWGANLGKKWAPNFH